ncbi:MAG: hypothetical protein ACRELC_07095 [Gemmatimonadota bacterium]
MSTYETVIVIGMILWILVALAIFVGLVYAIRLVRQLREPLRQIAGTARDVQDRLKPVLRNVERASEDASYLVTSVRSDAGELGDALRHASESTHRMLNLAEERVTEVAALLAVVQEEAEETFLSTAGLLRGLRGARERKSGVKRVARAIGNLGRD